MISSMEACPSTRTNTYLSSGSVSANEFKALLSPRSVLVASSMSIQLSQRTDRLGLAKEVINHR